MGAGKESKLTVRWYGITWSVVITKYYDIIKKEREKDRKKESEKLKENKISRNRYRSSVWRCSQVKEGRAGYEEVSEDSKALETG